MLIIGIGTNLGKRNLNIEKALIALAKIAPIIARSETEETKAILPDNAPVAWNLSYLNLVVGMDLPINAMEPEELLSELKAIEFSMGRDLSAPRWSPRIIDLDILQWENLEYKSELVQIPHPELQKREFLIKAINTFANRS